MVVTSFSPALVPDPLQIDHSPRESRYARHTNGTFRQCYYLESSSYKPGGPIFVFICGDVPIEYYATLLESSLVQDLVQKISGYWDRPKEPLLWRELSF